MIEANDRRLAFVFIRVIRGPEVRYAPDFNHESHESSRMTDANDRHLVFVFIRVIRGPEVRYAPGVLLQFGAPFSARRKRSMTRKLKSLFLSFRVFRVFRCSFSVPKRARQEACRMRLVTSSPTPSFVCFAKATTFLRPRRRHLIKRELILCYTHFCVFRVFCAQPIACETECPR